MCRFCLKLQKWCFDDEGDSDPDVIATFFRTDLSEKIKMSPYPQELPMYNVLFGFYQGYFNYNPKKDIYAFHSALVNGTLHAFLMNSYEGMSSGYLTAVRQRNLNLDQISNGEIAKNTDWR